MWRIVIVRLEIPRFETRRFVGDVGRFEISSLGFI